MKKREKMLLAALVGVLALWQGGNLLNKFVLEPVVDAEADKVTRQERNWNKKKLLKQSQAAARRLKDWNLASLPPDPVIATSMYQVWLVDLATRSKLVNTTVTPNNTEVRARGGDAYHVVSATIKAQGTLERLCDFLYEFRRAGLLHRVARIQLSTEQHQGDPPLDIELTVEGLALKGAPPRTTLLADPNLADLVKDKSAKERKDYASLVAKNLFVRGYNGPPKPAPPKAPGTGPAGPEDGREFVRLVGVVAVDGAVDATLRDLSTNKKIELAQGTAFSIAGIDGKVVSIGNDFVTFDIKGETWRMELGDNLLQLKKLPAPTKVEASATDAASAPGAAAR